MLCTITYKNIVFEKNYMIDGEEKDTTFIKKIQI